MEKSFCGCSWCFTPVKNKKWIKSLVQITINCLYFCLIFLFFNPTPARKFFFHSLPFLLKHFFFHFFWNISSEISSIIIAFRCCVVWFHCLDFLHLINQIPPPSPCAIRRGLRTKNKPETGDLLMTPWFKNAKVWGGGWRAAGVWDPEGPWWTGVRRSARERGCGTALSHDNVEGMDRFCGGERGGGGGHPVRQNLKYLVSRRKIGRKN